MQSLVLYDNARRAMAEAHRVDEVKDVLDRMVAVKEYARRAGDREMEIQAAEIQLWAMRRAGELLREMDKARGGGDVRGINTPTDEVGVNDSPTLADIGISHNQSSQWQKLAATDDEVFEEFLCDARETGRPATVSALKRKLKVAVRQEPAAQHETCTVDDLAALAGSGQKFGTIYADPPWRYGNQATRASTGNHYDGMSVDEIAALPVAGMAAENAHLHLWTTNGFLFDAKAIIEAWGFEYRSCYIWVKPQMGIGNYWRVSHEFLLLAKRGSATFKDRSLKSWGEFPRGKHSSKPEEIRRLIERAGDGPRLEMFGRNVAEGWTVWGNQIERNLFRYGLERVA